MYILLEPGDEVKDTDEWFDFQNMQWCSYIEYGIPFEFVPEGCGPIRREVTDKS